MGDLLAGDRWTAQSPRATDVPLVLEWREPADARPKEGMRLPAHVREAFCVAESETPTGVHGVPPMLIVLRLLGVRKPLPFTWIVHCTLLLESTIVAPVMTAVRPLKSSCWVMRSPLDFLAG